MPKVSIDTSLNTVQVVKSGNDLQKTMDKLGRSIEKTFDGRKASGLGDALKPLSKLPPSWKKRTPMPTRPPTRLKK